MEVSRFDSISKLFADRRLSRREALVKGGVGLAAAGAATAGLSTLGNSTATAQDATPEAATDPDKTMFLFLQSFESANIVPKEGVADTYTLTLEHGLGQTVFFSDRPERIVGAAPTPQFLDGLGFYDDNPPNAALLVSGGGHTDIIVLELFSPQYESVSHTATYDVKLLQRWEDTLTVAFSEVPLNQFDNITGAGGAHLFIDDCSSRGISCARNDKGWGQAYGVGESFGLQGFCYKWRSWGCYPCEPKDEPDSDVIYSYWAGVCNNTYAECEGLCYPIYHGTDLCSGDDCA